VIRRNTDDRLVRPVQEVNPANTESELASPIVRPYASFKLPREDTMTVASYKQFCPVAMAAEILCTRWTVVLLRELIAGSSRFNELRRGVPRMSPALLSQRLKDLEMAGIVARRASASETGVFEYQLTESGRELGPLVNAFGIWGQRRIESKLTLQHLDEDLLMWDMRRNLDTTPMPARRSTVEFIYPELSPAQRRWWLIVDPETGVDLCKIDPGFDVDLYVSVDLRSMTAIWLGLDTVRASIASRRMVLTGSRQLAASMQTWLGLSPFAKERKLAS
jgi:DNA-binding HxlR family transcriptional regulator